MPSIVLSTGIAELSFCSTRISILARWRGAEGHAMRPEWGFGLALKGHYYLSGPRVPIWRCSVFPGGQRGAVPVSSASSAPPASDKDTHCTETESGYNPGARVGRVAGPNKVCTPIHAFFRCSQGNTPWSPVREARLGRCNGTINLPKLRIV
jgi:hypothetical protein